MERRAVYDLLDQLRTGLVQAEELTRPELDELLTLGRERPEVVPPEVGARLRTAERNQGASNFSTLDSSYQD